MCNLWSFEQIFKAFSLKMAQVYQYVSFIKQGKGTMWLNVSSKLTFN